MRLIVCLAAALCLCGPAAAVETSLDLSVATGNGSSGSSENAHYRRATYGAGLAFHFGSPDALFNDVLSLGYRHGRVWGEHWNGERLDERYDNALLGNTFALGNRQMRVGPAFYVGGAATLEVGYGFELIARVPRERAPDVGATLGWSRMSEIDIMSDGRDTNGIHLAASLRWGRAR